MADRPFISFSDLVARQAKRIVAERNTSKLPPKSTGVTKVGQEYEVEVEIGGVGYVFSGNKEKAKMGELIRMRNGKFIGKGSLRNLMQSALASVVARELGKGSNFKLRTGRFANSANITSIRLTDSETLSMEFAYKVRPYAVFDSNYPLNTSKPQYHAMREKYNDPSDIITDAIGKIVTQTVQSRYNLIVKDANSGNSFRSKLAAWRR